ncbi:MAG TPA: hypothetical protein VFZ97_14675 [Acidimicrobiales bacterium]
MAAKCWAGIDSQRRLLLVDEDNLPPPLSRHYITDLRSDESGMHLNFEGLNAPDLKPKLRHIFEAARSTPSYEGALRADTELGRSRALTLRWAELARGAHEHLRSGLQGSTVSDARERALTFIDGLYAGTPVEAIATAFRQHNRLVHRILWCILGLAESHFGGPLVEDTVGTLRLRPDKNGIPVIRITTAQPAVVMSRPTHPIWLKSGTPLDGLWLIEGYTMNLGALSNDFSLTPLRWFAESWP